MRRIFAVVGLALCTACSSTATGRNATATGTVAGTSFSVNTVFGSISDASLCSEPMATACVGLGYTGQVVPRSGRVVTVYMTDATEASCAQPVGSSPSGDFTGLELTLFNANGDVEPGTYAIPSNAEDIEDAGALPTQAANASLISWSPLFNSCEDGEAEGATSGTVTLSAISPGGLSGTYAITFGGSGKSYAGHFDTPVCTSFDAGPSTVDASLGILTCL